MQVKNKGLKQTTDSDGVNGQTLPANYTPSNYTPTQVGSEGTDKISAHLKGIDAELTGGGGVNVYRQDQTFNGSDLYKEVDVSSTITDARDCIVQLLDNSNNYERVNCKLTAISASTIRIDTNVALPAGSYKLICME